MAKLENKTREISQMLNNLNKITATPEKKKPNSVNTPAVKTNNTTEEAKKDEEVQIVIESSLD